MEETLNFLNLSLISLLNALFNAVADFPYTMAIFLTILVVVFLWGWLRTSSLTQSPKKMFKNARKIIADAAKDTPEFFENFDEIDRKIRKDKNMRPLWREFSESTFHDAENRQICLSVRPSHYFHQNAVLSCKGNVQQTQAFPNYLIGLGLFFTFLGLAAALHVAQSGLKAGDENALQELLAVASIKFVSSLTAVLLSLALSFIQRGYFHRFRNAIGEFCAFIEERTEFVPAEKIATDTLGELKKQTGFQHDMAMNIADNLSAILAKSLPDSVSAALKPLADEIRALASKFQGGNQDAIKSVLEEFLAQLRKSSVNDMDALVSTVRSLKDALESLTENMRGTGQNFEQETKDSSARLSGMMERFTETFAPIQQGMSDFGKTLETLGNVAGNIERAGGGIGAASQTQERAAEGLSGAVRDISSQLEPIKEALTQLREYMQLAGDTAKQMRDAGGTMGGAAAGFERSVNAIGQAQERLSDRMGAFSQAAENVSGTAVALRQAAENIDRAARPLEKTSAGMEGVASAIKETESRIKASGEKLQKTLAVISQVSDLLPKTLASYESRFGKVDEDMEKAFAKLADGSAAFQHSVQEFVGKLDESFTKAVGSLAGAIEELAEEREHSAQPPQKT